MGLRCTTMCRPVADLAISSTNERFTGGRASLARPALRTGCVPSRGLSFSPAEARSTVPGRNYREIPDKTARAERGLSIGKIS